MANTIVKNSVKKNPNIESKWTNSSLKIKSLDSSPECHSSSKNTQPETPSTSLSRVRSFTKRFWKSGSLSSKSVDIPIEKENLKMVKNAKENLTLDGDIKLGSRDCKPLRKFSRQQSVGSKAQGEGFHGDYIRGDKKSALENKLSLKNDDGTGSKQSCSKISEPISSSVIDNRKSDNGKKNVQTSGRGRNAKPPKKCILTIDGFSYVIGKEIYFLSNNDKW